MTNQQALAILCEMQKWRRALPPYDGEEPKRMPYTPQEFGEAIDIAIEALNENE